MKELVIISGKGGTGKTSITGAFAFLAKNKVIVDCDVDASNLHIILNPEINEKKDFVGGKKAYINEDLCSQCGLCIKLCHFNAIENYYRVNQIKCEGCGVCEHFCPSGAIILKDTVSGKYYKSTTKYGKMLHASLGIAQENSGKLVTLLKTEARIAAQKENLDLILIDGAPGIGCPVIANISGVNLALIVTEPTLSALHDAKRAIKLCRHFNVKVALCINKYDVNEELSQSIEAYCKDEGIIFTGKIPYNKLFNDAQKQNLTVMELNDHNITENLTYIWSNVISALNKE